MDDRGTNEEPGEQPGPETTPIESHVSTAGNDGGERSGFTVRWLVGALVAVVVLAAAAIVWLFLTTVPNGDLDAANAELAAVRADLATTQADLAAARAELDDARQQAAADAAAAARRESDLNGVVAGLEDDKSGLQADLSAREDELSASQAEASRLADDLAAEQARADYAEAQVALASDAVEQSFATWEWYLAWLLWNDSYYQAVHKNNADTSAYDDLVQSLGLADTWAEWARTTGRDPVRELDSLIKDIGDTDLETLFDTWFDCDSRSSCIRTAVDLDGSVLTALTEYLRSVGEALGHPILFGSEL